MTADRTPARVERGPWAPRAPRVPWVPWMPQVGGEWRLWRAIDAYRAVTFGYATVLFALAGDEIRRPALGWSVLAVMAAWTVWITLRRDRTDLLLVADLAVTCLAVLSTRWVDDPARIAAGAGTLPGIWAATPVATYAVGRGWRWGLSAAMAVTAADVVEVWPHLSSTTVQSSIELIAVGLVVGYTIELYSAGRRDLALAVAVQAAAQERERLAADIHDSVLQVLAYIQRRGGELGGEGAELGLLAGEQEVRLRTMVAGRGIDRAAGSGTAPGTAPDDVDLSAALGGVAGREVSFAAPADPVLLPTPMVTAVLGAVGAALDNVRRHAGPGARAWLLIEQEADTVTVTVRDDGVGMAADRPADAAREGRLGMASSIRARVQAVGGSVTVTGAPGEGTEVELRVPRRRPSGSGSGSSKGQGRS